MNSRSVKLKQKIEMFVPTDWHLIVHVKVNLKIKTYKSNICVNRKCVIKYLMHMYVCMQIS